MKLWLIRHADTRTGRIGERDFDRDLSDSGNASAERFGTWLAQRADRPHWIVSSDAVRARATAAWAIRGAALEGAELHLDRRLYNASARTILDVIGETPPNVSALAIVAHNPGITQTAATLVGADAPPTLPPLGVVLIEVDSDWAHLESRSAKLLSYTHPGDGTW